MQSLVISVSYFIFSPILSPLATFYEKKSHFPQEIVEREVDDDYHADMISLFAVQSTEIISSKIETITFVDVVGVIEEIHLINTLIKCCPGLKSVNVKRNPAFPYDWEWYFEELSSIHGSLIVEDGQTRTIDNQLTFTSL